MQIIILLLTVGVAFSAFASGSDKLHEALLQYQAISRQGGWPQIPSGPRMGMGYEGKRVSLLRKRLQATFDLKQWREKNDNIFDKQLAKALLHFEKRHGILLEMSVGPVTLAELNVPVEKRLRQIQANLKREKALPGEGEESYIRVNIPDFNLYLVEKKKVRLEMKVIVGMPTWPTPVFSGKITQVVLNPRWYVPKNIERKELLQKMAKDPGYARHQNIKQIRVVGKTLFMQESGPLNPLGRFKFVFPNKHEVFLHDTPAKALFKEKIRTFSHGCIRIKKPRLLAQYLLKEESLKTDGPWKEKVIPLAKPFPIHLIYQTAWVDEKGILHFRPDIYGWDK